MMHAHNDTLALYGARHHSTAYYAIRATVRTLIVAIPLLGGFAYSLIPA